MVSALTGTAYPDSYYARTVSDDRLRPVLTDTVDAEICIVGGGLAGIATALGLSERGQRAVVLESARIGWGASGRNAGFVLSGFTKSPHKLIEAVGADHARRLYKLTLDAKTLIRARIRRYDIACDLRDGHLEASWYPDDNALPYEQDFLARNFDESSEIWPREKVRDLCRTEKYHAGLYLPGNFHLHPLNFLRGLAAAFEAQGGKIFEQTTATQLQRTASGFEIRTATGCVRANQVVLCGSSYFNGLNRTLKRGHIPVAAYMVTTDPLPPDVRERAIRFAGAISDNRLVCDYYRLLPDDSLIWGGRVGLSRRVPQSFPAQIMKDILTVYPQLENHLRIRTSWSGLMAHTVHRMPHVRQLEPGLWACTHFGSYGLAATTAGGEAVAAAIAANDDSYKLFEPFGLPWTGGPLGPLAAQMIYAAYRTKVAAKEWLLARQQEKRS